MNNLQVKEWNGKIVSYLPFDEVVNNPLMHNDSALSAEYLATITANSGVTFSEVVSIGTFENTYKWVGGIMARNGRIYAIPNGATQVLEINPATDTYCLFGNLRVADYKWSGGAVAKNGLIYCFPRRANSVLVINPYTQEAIEKSIGTSYSESQDHHYGGAMVGDKIYCCPRASGDIMVVDTTDWSTKVIGTTEEAYNSACYHSNGLVYMFATNTSGGRVLKIDPTTDIITNGGTTSIYTYGVIESPINNCIYGFNGSSTSAGIMKYDVSTDTGYALHTDVSQVYYSIETGINGKLYSVVGDATKVMEYDVENDTVTQVATVASGSAKCAGAAMAEDGSIYFIPAKGTTIFKLKFGAVVRTMPLGVLCSPFVSNY